MRSREQLIQDTEPFPDALIKQLDTGYDADYVEWHEYNQRLLLHHGSAPWHITSLVFGDGVWAVAGYFEIDGETYAGVGEDKSPTAAESNAYKRACAHAGIGLHLYNRKGYWLHGRLADDTN